MFPYQMLVGEKNRRKKVKRRKSKHLAYHFDDRKSSFRFFGDLSRVFGCIPSILSRKGFML